MSPLPKTANHSLWSNYIHNWNSISITTPHPRTWGNTGKKSNHRINEEWESDHEQTPALGDTPIEDIWYLVIECNVQNKIIRALDAEEINENRMDGM